MFEIREKAERAMLVGVQLPSVMVEESEESLDELALLADTAGAHVVDRMLQRRKRVDPALYLGRGAAERLGTEVAEQEIDVVLFDEDLSPAQARNLEEMIETKVVDRSGLILDIFARRARTQAAKIQVELAQLEYMLPRLTRQWTHLSRQAGGGGAAGGIGTRGPGETQLEVDRRLVRKRMKDLSKALERIERSRAVQRKGRLGSFQVALVGYTNAGKSTLLNALSGADAFVENRLFATLDAMTRTVPIAQKQHILLTDTVGFIRKLPPGLVASFRSTLEEVVEADLLLHVVDVNHRAYKEHIASVNGVLSDLHVLEKPSFLLLNKVDLIAEKSLITSLGRSYPDGIFICAKTGMGLDQVRSAIEARMNENTVLLHVNVPHSDGKRMAELETVGQVVDRQVREDHIRISVRVNREEAQKISGKVGRETQD
ncbi:MAG: GTPase HflX [Candidatus Latescibacterota bacterium]